MSFKEFTVERSSILPEVLSFVPSAFADLRGAIFTAYHRDIYSSFLDNDLEFKHDKFIQSKKDVLRGIHGDTKTWKLVTCAYGKIYQVVVDNRPESKTYRKWDCFELDDDNKRLVLIPPRFGNAFCILSEQSIYFYKLAYEGEYLDAGEQFTLKWNDPALKIKWPVSDPILQARDQ